MNLKCKEIPSAPCMRQTMPAAIMYIVDGNLGPVVQSIASLTTLLRGQLVKCFNTL